MSDSYGRRMNFQRIGRSRKRKAQMGYEREGEKPKEIST